MGMVGFATATKAELGHTFHPSNSRARNLPYRHSHTGEVTRV